METLTTYHPDAAVNNKNWFALGILYKNEYVDDTTYFVSKLQRFFGYIFTSDESMKEKNKSVLLYLNENLQNLPFVKCFLSEVATVNNDLHPSLIKSALIMTQSVDGTEQERANLEEILKCKLAN